MPHHLLALVLAASLSVPVTAPSAVAVTDRPTCEGRAATVVGPGSGAGVLVGTPRADVVVTAGATRVDTLGGDDLVCVTRGSSTRPEVRIDTAAGADRVVVVPGRSAYVRVRVALGEGADELVGGPENTFVTPDPQGLEPDAWPDRVATGSGRDSVSSAPSGRDVVDLGDGDDYYDVRASGQAADGSVDGGLGADRLVVDGYDQVPGALVVDTTTGAGTRDGAPWLRFASLERFNLRPADTLRFTGSDADELLQTSGDVDAELGGGDDRVLTVELAFRTPRFDGGDGVDALRFISLGSLTLDLVEGVARGRDTTAVPGFEHVEAEARGELVLLGSAVGQRLSAASCGEVRVEGRGGDDLVQVGEDCSSGGAGKATLLGGDGDDDLTGGSNDDVIDGGPGTDRADGGVGIDRCEGELVTRCEGDPGDARCQGLVPTIISDGTAPVEGTDGDDVIIARGQVEARAGDDTICASGTDIGAGPGDDSITVDDSDDLEPARIFRVVRLGDGDDHYVGGVGRDHVDSDDFLGPTDLGDDVVETGAGDDRVEVGSSDLRPQADVVDLGDGDDSAAVLRSGVSTDGALRGGPGQDTIGVANGVRHSRMVIDLDRRVWTFDGDRFLPPWSSFESHSARAERTLRATVRGTDGPDDVRIDGPTRVDVRLLGGDDAVRHGTSEAATGVLDGGAGRDLVWIRRNRKIVVDLARGWAGRPSGRSDDRVALVGFRDVIATGGTALVLGDDSGNRVTLACGRVEAAGGDDVVRQGTLPSFLGGDVLTTTCSVEVDGGPGRDRITGSLGPDVLVGGPGVDRVDGLAGRDRCVAERRVRCER